MKAVKFIALAAGIMVILFIGLLGVVAIITAVVYNPR